MTLRRLAPIGAVLFAACSANYDFARARLPSGEWDLPKLIADLNASGEKELHDTSWVPLIHLRRLRFAPSVQAYPTGYTLSELAASGPIFCGAALDDRIVDAQGAPVESIRKLWLGWGLVYHDHTQRIETDHGTRESGDWRAALLFGNDRLDYLPRAKAPVPPQ